MRSFPALTCVTNGDRINFSATTSLESVVPAAHIFFIFISKLPIVDRSGRRLSVMSPAAAPKKKPVFDQNAFLATIGKGQKTMSFAKRSAIFSQGDAADAVFYIQEGKVRLTVVSNIGKEATVGILTTGDFCGESCLAGQPQRMGSAI